MVFRQRKNDSSPRRVFAIGDIHGCAIELGALITKLNLTENDLVVFLGDYIDRGPNSKGVIDLILDLRERCDVVTLMGNHESMLIDFLDRPDTQGAGMFILNGGAATLLSYTEANEETFSFPQEHLDFFRSLRITYETETHFFVHAGVPNTPLKSINLNSDESVMQLLWMRQPFLSSQYKWEKMVVHGHTPMTRAEVLTNRINLDTGCVYGNALTALEIPGHVLHSVERGTKDLHSAPFKENGDRIMQRFSGHLPVRALCSRTPGQVYDFETLNYNQFGLLMRETQAKTAHPSPNDLRAGDQIEGEIGGSSAGGNGKEGAEHKSTIDVVKFVGSVVRVDSRGEFVLYAVRIDKIAGGVWGADWLERPAS